MGAREEPRLREPRQATYKPGGACLAREDPPPSLGGPRVGVRARVRVGGGQQEKAWGYRAETIPPGPNRWAAGRLGVGLHQRLPLGLTRSPSTTRQAPNLRSGDPCAQVLDFLTLFDLHLHCRLFRKGRKGIEERREELPWIGEKGGPGDPKTK